MSNYTSIVSIEVRQAPSFNVAFLRTSKGTAQSISENLAQIVDEPIVPNQDSELSGFSYLKCVPHGKPFLCVLCGGLDIKPCKYIEPRTCKSVNQPRASLALPKQRYPISQKTFLPSPI